MERIVAYPSEIVGEVAFYYLQYVPLIYKHFPGVYLPIIKRPKAATVDSFVRVQHTLGVNHFTDMTSEHWDGAELGNVESVTYRNCFPKYDKPMVDAIASYYDEYYAIASDIERQVERCRIFDMDYVLNTEDGQDELFQFLGYDSGHVVPKIKIYKEAGGDNG